MISARNTSTICPIPVIRQGSSGSLSNRTLALPKRKHFSRTATAASFPNKALGIGKSLPDFLIGTAAIGLISWVKDRVQEHLLRAEISSRVVMKSCRPDVLCEPEYIDRSKEAKQLVRELRCSNEHVILYGRGGIGKSYLMDKATAMFSGIIHLSAIKSVEELLEKVGNHLGFKPRHKPEGASLLNFAGQVYHKAMGDNLVVAISTTSFTKDDDFRVFLEASQLLDRHFITLVLICDWGGTKKGLIQACDILFLSDHQTRFIGPVQPILTASVVTYIYHQFRAPMRNCDHYYEYSGGSLSLLLSVLDKCKDVSDVKEVERLMVTSMGKVLDEMGFNRPNNRGWVARLFSAMISNNKVEDEEKILEFESLIPHGASVNGDIFLEDKYGEVRFSCPAARDAASIWLQEYIDLYS